MALSAVDISTYAPRFEIIVNGSRLSADVSHVISSLEIEQELNKMNSFKFQVQDEYAPAGAQGAQSARPFRWLGHPLFKFGNDVSLSLGYLTLQKMTQGKIQNISASFTHELAPTFSVEGADSAYVFLTTPSDVEPYRDKTDSDIVSQIANQAQLTADVDATSEVFPVKIKQGGKSYLQFIEELAKSNGYEYSLSGRTLSFVRPKTDRPPDMSFTWGRNLLSFNPRLRTDAVYTEVIVRAWDRSGRKMIEARANAGDEHQQESQKQFGSQVAQQIYGQAVRVITDRPVTSQAEARKIALAELQRSSDGLIEATIEMVGRPDLRPGTRIQLDGVGEWFSGKYYVNKATHRISNQGYRTSCEMKRNAL
jgi:phage protein D